MNYPEQLNCVNEFFNECLALQKTKGKDYTTNGDVFYNIKTTAEECEITPEKVLWIAFRKHYIAVQQYIRSGKLESESIKSRLIDIANYVSLLAAFIEAKEEEEL